jgi:hypothetical protein
VTYTTRVPGDTCYADPDHPLPGRVLAYTQDRTTPRAKVTVVCGPTCKTAADRAWATGPTVLHMPPIDPTRRRPPPRHEATCPEPCAYCDGRIAARDDT